MIVALLGLVDEIAAMQRRCRSKREGAEAQKKEE